MILWTGVGATSSSSFHETCHIRLKPCEQVGFFIENGELAVIYSIFIKQTLIEGKYWSPGMFKRPGLCQLSAQSVAQIIHPPRNHQRTTSGWTTASTQCWLNAWFADCRCTINVSVIRNKGKIVIDWTTLHAFNQLLSRFISFFFLAHCKHAPFMFCYEHCLLRAGLLDMCIAAVTWLMFARKQVRMYLF